MENSITWLLVCDASKARLYSMHKARLFSDPSAHNLELVNKFAHDASRKKGRDLETDRMGTQGSETFEESTPLKVQEAEKFVHELLAHLESGRKSGNYRDLIIVAPPEFMGLLRKHMHHDLQRMVVQNIEKNYTQDNDKDLLHNLMQHF